ncbi:tRNA dihydrouridine(20/20a) synthase DusA [Allopusillimonas ginsengisoli]|uniref:tRNA dihydrouridine(20/20a) synthase DusA n=1 Tax=Allopusillimonas ginsengisoli TaxID=453575 RepID=UPI002468AE4B|nr:tRNA dihydrouridine(20/20a) synthase DusA [Allopusillimonas ginsengisoli]
MPPSAGWRLCVAPMIDVTDRHCRYFHRLLAPGARLYTEMITTGALMHGDVARHLNFDPAEHPVALQVGGSEPDALARSALLGERWGYDEVNLNCGCPSERVQRGAFGACLMAEPALVADCVKAMQDAVSIPVTVKHRLGLDYDESYGFVRDFVGKVYDTGCRVFIVHARNAVLKGLSPKDNREKPPLRYDAAARLKADFPDCIFVLNGGITQKEDALSLMAQFDGVMLGRAAWHNPGILSDIVRDDQPHVALLSTDEVVRAMVDYADSEIQKGVPLRIIARAMLGWMAGRTGARQWRRTLSDPAQLNANDPGLFARAWEDIASRNSAGEAVIAP